MSMICCMQSNTISFRYVCALKTSVHFISKSEYFKSKYQHVVSTSGHLLLLDETNT